MARTLDFMDSDTTEVAYSNNEMKKMELVFGECWLHQKAAAFVQKAGNRVQHVHIYIQRIPTFYSELTPAARFAAMDLRLGAGVADRAATGLKRAFE